MEMNDQVAVTDRLRITRLTAEDAGFILRLLNEPAFIRFIGDRKICTERDAATYLSNGPIDSYQNNGFGLYKVSSNQTHQSLGMCGLVKRNELELPDIGFAFFQEKWGNGYAYESSVAVLRHAAVELKLDRVAAIVNADNSASLRLLHKLGFTFEKMVRMTGESEDICQYAIALQDRQR